MLFLTGLLHLGLALALWAFRPMELDRRLTYFWLVGQLAGAIGMLMLLGLRGGSLFWFSSVPNALVFLSMTSYVVLFRRFFHMPIGWLWYLLVFLVLIQLVLRSFGLPDHLRLFWAVSGSVVNFALVLHTLWQQRRSGYSLVPFLLAINTLVITGLALRATEALLAGDDYSFLNAGLGQELGVLALFISAQVNGVGFLLLLKECADRELVRLATLDPLTEVANRRSFIVRLKQQVAQTDRTGQPLSVLMCDLDHFKHINDQYGHHAGDEVIRALVAVARQIQRGGDHIGRWGGEEFVILLPNTDLVGAAEFATRLNRCVAEKRISYNARQLSITVSVGVSEYVLGEDIQQTIDRADAALYRAKQNGRNRVETMTYNSTSAAAASV